MVALHSSSGKQQGQLLSLFLRNGRCAHHQYSLYLSIEGWQGSAGSEEWYIKDQQAAIFSTAYHLQTARKFKVFNAIKYVVATKTHTHTWPWLFSHCPDILASELIPCTALSAAQRFCSWLRRLSSASCYYRDCKQFAAACHRNCWTTGLVVTVRPHVNTKTVHLARTSRNSSIQLQEYHERWWVKCSNIYLPYLHYHHNKCSVSWCYKSAHAIFFL